MKEDHIELLGIAYDMIQELEKTINELTKDKPIELGVRARASFVLDQINDAIYKTL